MIFNLKSKIKGEDDNEMFEMTKIGSNISKLRKKSGFTQMELADKLGISFQAVSNWERGQSCPDISKLNELSMLFGVSIDNILENKRASAILEEIAQDQPVPDINKDELEKLAPILRDEQVDKLVEESKSIDLKQIFSVAPFLSQAFIDGLAERIIKETNSLNDIAGIAPFVSTNLLDNFAIEIIKNGGNFEKFAGIAPFISSDIIDKCADDSYAKTGSFSSFGSIAPFISSEKIDSYVMKANEQGGLSTLAPIAPFISTDLLNNLAKEALEKHGLNALSPIMPFIDSNILEDYIKLNMFK